jgi:aspartyl-tRNA(Asn)/glutamyl-tRNA(Gln) amidotransferase subunit A
MKQDKTFIWPEIETLRYLDLDQAEYKRQIQDRIQTIDPEIGAFLQVADLSKTSTKDYDSAEKLDHTQKLNNVPVAIKDNIAVSGMPMTCASKILQRFIPTYNATVVKKLQQAGAMIAGKTNMDEFAMGSSTENSAYKSCRNPWDKQCVAGGSSGGSAAAVAAGLVPVALGSDTGGSVRQPAAFCGIIGFKPSYGMISRFGLVAYASSLDQIGILANRIDDVKQIFDVIRGIDDRDETVTDFEELSIDPKDLPKVRVGLVKEYTNHPAITLEIRDTLDKVVHILKKMSVEVVEINLPMLDETVIPAYYLTACAEASSNLARYDGVRYGKRFKEFSEDIDDLVCGTRTLFGPEVRLRVLLGTFILRAGHYEQFYGRAQAARLNIARGLQGAFREVDFLLTPTAPTLAFKIGEYEEDPLAMKLADLFTVTANLAGLPAISIPVDLVDNLPSAVQLMGARFDDFALLNFSKKLASQISFDLAQLPYASKQPVISFLNKDTL